MKTPPHYGIYYPAICMPPPVTPFSSLQKMYRLSRRIVPHAANAHARNAILKNIHDCVRTGMSQRDELQTVRWRPRCDSSRSGTRLAATHIAWTDHALKQQLQSARMFNPRDSDETSAPIWCLGLYLHFPRLPVFELLTRCR